MGYFEDLTKVFDVELMALGTDNGLPVALENINAPASTDTPYLASYMLLSETEQADLGWTERRPGIYQIDVYAGQMTGSAKINKMADMINAHFKTGSHFRRNEICATVTGVSLGPLLVENGWARRPLSINFVAYTERL